MNPIALCCLVAAVVIGLMAVAPLLFKKKDAALEPGTVSATAPKASLVDKVHAMAVDAGTSLETAFEKAKADLANVEKALKAQRAARQQVELSVVAAAANQLDNLYHEAANIVDAAERDEALKKLADAAAFVLPSLIKAGVMLPK